jgi:phosphomevalonate kinase
MWGRFANIAEQLDANVARMGDAGNKNNDDKLIDDNDPKNNLSMTPSSDADYEDDEGGSGWGASDGDDLDFDDDGDDEDMGSNSGVDASYDDVDVPVEEGEDEEDTTALDSSTNPEEVTAAPPPTTTATTAPLPTVQQPQSPPHSFPEMVSVSAPGKALVAGGYLVLESPNPGVVLAADGCRFHTTIMFRQPCNTSTEGGVIGNAINATWESIPLDVYSPQFDKIFCYYLSYSLTTSEEDDDEDDVLRLQPRTASYEPNKFVERTLLLAFGYLRQSLGMELFHSRFRHHGLNSNERVALAIKLRADNDFYSQINHLKQRGLDLTPQNVESLEPFLPCPKDSQGKVIVNKTGMGSSAALVTSIVGALLQFFGASSLPTMIDGETTPEAAGQENHEEGLRIAHNLAQICHCYAQGKVGSGFDVSSAVFGSHVYTRFSKGIINKFIEDVELRNKTVKGGLSLAETNSSQLFELVIDAGKKWDCTVQPINLPDGLELLMADVCGGSESPSMARKILEWKTKNRETGFLSGYYWKDLKRCNKKIASLLSDQYTNKSFCDGLVRDGQLIIASRTAEQWKKPMPSTWYEFDGSSWDVAMQLLDLRMAFLESRQNLKGMGNAAGVPVEPDSQTALADATMKLPGVVAAGVPGAGGYDALFVIYVKGPPTNEGKSDQVRDDIGNLWRDMSNQDNNTVVCPLSVRAAGSGGLCASSLQW